MDRGQLRWRAGRHALLELDIVFARFLAQHFDSLDDASCERLSELLALEDHDLWEMVSGRRDTENPEWVALIDLLRECGRAGFRDNPEGSGKTQQQG